MLSAPSQTKLGRTAQAGVALIEVLVAVLVVSLGMLAMAGMMGSAAQLSKTAEFRAMALMQMTDIVDRIRVNRNGLANYNWVPQSLTYTAPQAVVCANPAACTPAEMAAVDVAQWSARLFGTLPNGTGYLSVTDAGAGLLDVWVMWKDPAALSGEEFMNAGSANRQCPPGFNDTPTPRCVFMRVAL